MHDWVDSVGRHFYTQAACNAYKGQKLGVAAGSARRVQIIRYRRDFVIFVISPMILHYKPVPVKKIIVLVLSQYYYFASHLGHGWIRTPSFVDIARIVTGESVDLFSKMFPFPTRVLLLCTLLEHSSRKTHWDDRLDNWSHLAERRLN